MEIAQLALAVFGLLLILGGYFGWKAGSQVSLIMGLASGIIVLIAVCITRSNPQLGFSILIAVSSLLSVVFLSRWAKTKKIMPSGMLFLMSLAAAVIAIKNFLNP